MDTDVTISVASSVIRSDTAGFSRLARLAEELSVYRNTKIKIDIGRVTWLDAHLAAPLLIVIRRTAARGNRVEFINPQPDVGLMLRKILFLAGAATDTHGTTMPTTEFDLADGVKFSLYAKKHLSRKEVPDMTPALQGKFFEGIDELFANSSLHSNASIKLAVCGQFYPRNRRLDFTLADGGRTISGSLRDAKIDFYSDDGAIAWAMEPYNTTRQGDIPGGLGSKLLREFIELNGGKLIVVSRAGFWCQKGAKVIHSLLSHPFPGTAVILEINTADRNKYDLVNPPSPKDIW
jgi:hypothetical protein